MVVPCLNEADTLEVCIRKGGPRTMRVNFLLKPLCY